MKGGFFIKAKEGNAITEKGVKAFIMERLLNSPFKKGCALNIDDKTVRVELEGDEKQIKEFIKNLEKALIARLGNPAVSFTAFEENQALEIPALMRSSQALVVGQLEKGISVQLEILETLKNMGDTLKNMGQSIKDLPREFTKALK